MKRCIITIMSFIVLLMVSCNAKHDGRISAALSLVKTCKYDSAILVLKHINRDRLSEPDRAMYALVYTMTQDKSGLDVSGDSLVRIAYDWYGKRPTDTLYAKTMYYMGKYYALNDSSEKALVCFQKSIASAKKLHDDDTRCLSLFQQSVILRNYDTRKAVACAKAVVNIYNKVKGAKPSNKSYCLLNLAECIAYGDGNTDECISLAKDAIKYALQSRDSTTISDSYQDLAAFYEMKGNYDFALKASKISNDYNKTNNFSKTFALSQYYVSADSLDKARLCLATTMPLNLNDSCLLFSLKRTIAIREHNWVDAEAFADSTENYLDRENSENLKARNNYYSQLIQKEVARGILENKNLRKSYLMLFLGIAALVITLLTIFYFHQKGKFMRETMENEEKLHQMEVKHKERQLKTMRKFLLSRIGIVKRLKSIKRSELIKLELTDEDWDEIEVFLNNVDDEFVVRLKKEFTDLTQKDIRFLMLVRLKIPYDSIASIFSIQEKSVKQRLFLFKKKLGLDKCEKSTREFIETY